MTAASVRPTPQNGAPAEPWRPTTSFRRPLRRPGAPPPAAPATPGLDALMDSHLDFVATVDLREMHANVIVRRSGDVLADEVRADRKLAMAAVHENGKADRTRTPVIDKRIHGRADGAA